MHFLKVFLKRSSFGSRRKMNEATVNLEDPAKPHKFCATLRVCWPIHGRHIAVLRYPWARVLVTNLEIYVTFYFYTT